MKKNIFIIAIVTIVSTINVIVSIDEIKEISNICLSNIESLAASDDDEVEPPMTKCNTCHQSIKQSDFCCPYCNSTNRGYSSSPTYSGRGNEGVVSGTYRDYWKGSRHIISYEAECEGQNPSNCTPGLKER